MRRLNPLHFRLPFFQQLLLEADKADIVYGIALIFGAEIKMEPSLIFIKWL